MAAQFSYPQAVEISLAFARHGVRYLFLGKSGAILLGFPDTTQDADLFVEKSEVNGRSATIPRWVFGSRPSVSRSARA